MLGLVAHYVCDAIVSKQRHRNAEYSTLQILAVALMIILDQRVVEVVYDDVDKQHTDNCKQMYGFKLVYRSQHYLTPGG